MNAPSAPSQGLERRRFSLRRLLIFFIGCGLFFGQVGIFLHLSVAAVKGSPHQSEEEWSASVAHLMLAGVASWILLGLYYAVLREWRIWPTHGLLVGLALLGWYFTEFDPPLLPYLYGGCVFSAIASFLTYLIVTIVEASGPPYRPRPSAGGR